MTDLYNYIQPKTGKVSPMISKQTYDTIMKNAERLNSAIIYDRDYKYNYFGFKVRVYSSCISNTFLACVILLNPAVFSHMYSLRLYVLMFFSYDRLSCYM